MTTFAKLSHIATPTIKHKNGEENGAFVVKLYAPFNKFPSFAKKNTKNVVIKINDKIFVNFCSLNFETRFNIKNIAPSIPNVLKKII